MLWLCLVLLLLPSWAFAANTHGTPDEARERQAWFGDLALPYIHSGCLPTVPASSLTLGSFACAGYVRGSAGDLVYVTQPPVPVGPLSGGDGVFWLAIHRNTSAAVSGWTRQAGTHYLWRKVDAKPSIPEGLVVTKITVAGSIITALEDQRVPSSAVRSGVYDVTDPLFGGVCDGVTDTTAPIQKAFDTVPVGGKVVLPGGNCITSGTLHISRAIAVHGAGKDQTIIRNTVPTIPVMRISSVNVHAEGFSVLHTGTPVAGGDGLVVRAPDGYSLQSVNLYHIAASWNYRGFVLGCMAYATGMHLEAQHNNSHGFEWLYEDVPACGVDQWDLIHANATLNKGIGFFGHNAVYAFGLGPWLTQSISFGNNQGGYVFSGSPGHPINDLRFHNVLSSADNVAGIFLDTYGGSHIISEPWIEYTGALAGFPIGTDNETSVKSNSGHCLGLTVNNGATSIVGGLYWNCSWSGVALYAPYTTMTGGKSLGNGQAMDADLARRAGVTIGAPGVLLSGHAFTFPGLTTLFYIHLAGVIHDLSIGLNTYASDLSVDRFVANQATFSAGRLPSMVAGLSVFSNTAASPGLQLYDATQGVTPLKGFRVTTGSLQILNSAGSAAIHTLSDVGTPGWPSRRGAANVDGVNSSVNIGLTPNEPDIFYNVQVTPVNSTGTPAAGAFTVTRVTKQTTGFEVVMQAAPGAGNSVMIDWFVHR